MVNQPVSLMVSLLLLLALSKMMGEIMERLKQPAMIGEILAGVILGPAILNIIQPGNDIKIIADIGVFFLIILTGLDVNLDDIRESIKGRNIWIEILSFVIPLFSGLLLGYLYGFTPIMMLFLGLCISITALPVSVRILLDLNKLNTLIANKIIAAAIFNDIISLLILGIIIGVEKNFNNINEITYSIILTSGKIILFIIVVLVTLRLWKYARQRVAFINEQLEHLLGILKGQESLFAMIIIFVLLFASISDVLGLHFIVGGFFAAMILKKELLGTENFKSMKQSINSISMGFLVPVFFAFIGLQYNFHAVLNYGLLIAVVVVSVLSKMAGGFIGGKLNGMSNRESYTLSIGLNPRGIIEVVIAEIALSNHFIDVSFFSILITIGVFTTLISPILLKRSFDILDKKQAVI
jgi:Kef-type K+ transport system membrane component KefB